MSASGATRASLWRHPDFIKIWTAATVSLFGTSISQIAIPVIAVLVLHAKPFEFALIETISFLPWLLFTLPAGVWVDRLPRRRILISSDLARAAMLITIPIASALNVLTIYQLYVVGFLNGVLTVFFDVADQSYLPTVVERGQLIEGNSKLQLSSSSAQLLGQPAGGAVVALITAPFAVILDAFSYVASAFLILGIKRQEPRVKTGTLGEKGPGMRAEIAEGLRYILSNPMLSKIAACTGSSNLFSNISFAVLPLYILEDLQMSVPQYGALGGFLGAGVLLGALVADRISRWFGVGRTILGAVALGRPPRRRPRSASDRSPPIRRTPGGGMQAPSQLACQRLRRRVPGWGRTPASRASSRPRPRAISAEARSCWCQRAPGTIHRAIWSV